MRTKELRGGFLVLALTSFLAACGGGGGGTPAAPTPVSIEVTPTKPQIAISAIQQFAARGLYSNGSSQYLTSSVTWSSSDETRATVNAAGLVTASSSTAGLSTISATEGGVTGTVVLRVVINLPKTGLTTCYDSGGTVISCATTSAQGQDGALQKGVAWSSPRFTDNSDGTFTDNRSGLMWLSDPNCTKTASYNPDNMPDGSVSWQHALDFIKGMNDGTYSACTASHADWRLPNVNELLTLPTYTTYSPALQSGISVSGTVMGEYWSSTSNQSNGAWAVSMFLGQPTSLAKGGVFMRKWVWPVRGTASGVVRPAKTGQTTCHDDSGAVIACAGTGQDGESQNGVAWPTSRFINNGDGTITDNLTGLMWLRDANCVKTVLYDPDSTGDGTVTWENALVFAVGVNDDTYAACQAGYKDWRIPNIIEMISLSQMNPTGTWTALSSAGFINAVSGWYWSSTTGADLPDYAQIIALSNGGWARDPKSNFRNFLLVR